MKTHCVTHMKEKTGLLDAEDVNSLNTCQYQLAEISTPLIDARSMVNGETYAVRAWITFKPPPLPAEVLDSPS